MAKSELYETAGVIVDVMPGSMFKVKVEEGVVIMAYSSGKMRKNKIKLLLGDKVRVAISPYDKTKGIIVLRT